MISKELEMSTLEHSALLLYFFGLLFLLVTIAQVIYYKWFHHLDPEEIYSTFGFAVYFIALGTVCSIADGAVKRNVHARRMNHRPAGN